jgi:hypothetical protein
MYEWRLDLAVAPTHQLRMGSKAASHVRLPGVPQHSDFAYLAALLDRGGFCARAKSSTVGLKVVAPPKVRNWLVMRFGGQDTTRAWWLTRQADVRYVLTRVRPYLVVRGRAAGAMIELIDHLASRESYHGDPEWRRERDRLKGAVRAASDAPRRGPRPAAPAQASDSRSSP